MDMDPPRLTWARIRESNQQSNIQKRNYCAERYLLKEYISSLHNNNNSSNNKPLNSSSWSTALRGILAFVQLLSSTMQYNEIKQFLSVGDDQDRIRAPGSMMGSSQLRIKVKIGVNILELTTTSKALHRQLFSCQ